MKLDEQIRDLSYLYGIDEIYDIVLKFKNDFNKKFEDFFLGKYNDCEYIEWFQYVFYFDAEYYVANPMLEGTFDEEGVEILFNDGEWVFCHDVLNGIFYCNAKEILLFNKSQCDLDRYKEKISTIISKHFRLHDYTIKFKFNI